MDQSITEELNKRKETLNTHLAKFDQLKKEGRWSEAWNQLLITLNYANDTLKYSADLLKSLSGTSEVQEESIDKVVNTIDNKTKGLEKPKPSEPFNKMIVIPKNPSTH